MSDTDRSPGGTEPAGPSEGDLDDDLTADKAVPADGETPQAAAERDTRDEGKAPADDAPADDTAEAGDPAATQTLSLADDEDARDGTSPADPAEPSTDTAPVEPPAVSEDASPDAQADGTTDTATPQPPATDDAGDPASTPGAPTDEDDTVSEPDAADAGTTVDLSDDADTGTAKDTSGAADASTDMAAGTTADAGGGSDAGNASDAEQSAGAAATTPDLTVIDPPEPAAPSTATGADGEAGAPAHTNATSGSGDAKDKNETASEGVGDAGADKTAAAQQEVAAAKPPADTTKKARKGGMDAKKKHKKQRGKAARIGRRVLFVVLGLVGLAVAAFGVAYLLTPVPSPQEEAVAQGPTFLYSDGKTQIAKTGVNRDAVRLDTIPRGVRDAVIAAENRSFYDDPGVSVPGTLRAFWSTVSGEQLQGGSTITQQMVRNYYGGIGKERSITRKLKEIMVSLKVGREKSKDWILEQYLNTIYFGRDAYGVQAAAQAYYGKDVGQLTPAEGAYLAAAIQQPSNFADPSGSTRAYAESRWRAVVNNMVRDGAVTSADAARMTFPQPVKQKVTNILGGQKGYMVNIAKRELTERRGYTEDEINRSGLKITTTFDKELMDAAQQAVRGNLPKRMSTQIRTGLVSVDPETGQVLAFYGGRGYLEEALSSAFSDWAQAGSGFKPIVLAAALDSGMSLNTYVDGSSPQYYNGSPIHNDGNRSYGTINLVTSTQNSVNTAYVNLGQKVGLDKVTKMAEKMGIPKSQLTANGANKYPTFPLGTISVHPVQQAGVYATFASEGVHHTPYVVKSVTDNTGKTTRFSEKGKRVFDEQVARDATYAMRRVVEAGTGRNAQLPDGRDVAGKTGTTDAGRAIWFNGFIPQLATSVAMFRSDGKPLVIPGYGVYGGQLPAQIWHSYVSRAVNAKGYTPKEFGSPSVSPGSYVGEPDGRQNDAPTTRGPGLRPSVPERPGRPSSRPPSDIPRDPVPPPGGGTGDGGDGGGDGGTGGGDGGGDGGGSDGGSGDVPPRPEG
ncbi:transglycosylase domain-containing protein [Actinomadura sp. NPDC047616]|uniref:transglycosylase domain-containing protein n=1 Tax=Actinomadura sp. NPDC047616 TaxID=3155914 RepID=UPI0033C85185